MICLAPPIRGIQINPFTHRVILKEFIKRQAEILGGCRFRVHDSVGSRMPKREADGVQATSREQGPLLFSLFSTVVGLNRGEAERLAASVDRIDQQWKSRRLEMNTDLMRSAGQRFADKQRRGAESCKTTPSGDCRFSLVRVNLHPISSATIRGDGTIDRSFLVGRASGDDSQVEFADLPMLELKG